MTEKSPFSALLRFGARQVGILAACSVALFANLLVHRFDRRWDLTPDQRYTPPQALGHALRRLEQEVTVTVLLSHTDPIAPTIEQLLESYRATSRHIAIDWVDPDSDSVHFLARQSELGIMSGRTEDGEVTSDALVVLTSRGRRHHIAAEEVVGLEPDASDGTSQFEHAFLRGLRRVLDQSSPIVCFTSGFRELSTTDSSPVGLSRFKLRLERDGIATKDLDLAGSDATSDKAVAPVDCQLIVVAAPDVPLSESAIARLVQSASHSSLLLLGGVVPDADGKLIRVGLERLAELGGIALGANVVVELDDAFRLPNLFGETFLATPTEHPTTRGLLRVRSASPLRVMVSLAQTLEKQPGSQAWPLLVSSSASVAVTDVSQRSIAAIESNSNERKSRVVAMAAPLSAAAGSQRRVVVAPANLWQNRTFDTPSALVTQAFALSVVSWLVANPSEPEPEFEPRPARAAGLELSEAEFREIARYVSLVMPGCFFLMGMTLLWQRSRRKASRAHPRIEGGP